MNNNSKWMLKELEDKKYFPKNYNTIKTILKDLSLLENGKTRKKIELRSYVNEKGECFKGFSEKLFETYIDLTNEITFHYADESKATHYEYILSRKIKKYTRRKFFSSLWIGNFCVDLFFPQIKLAFEIDGGIHNEELKMRKDEFKDIFLKNNFGIPVKHICNEDVIGNRIPNEIIDTVKSAKSVGSKNLKRMWRDISISTIARLLPSDSLNDALDVDILGIAKDLYFCDLRS